MTHSELKLNRSGDIDLVHYQRLAEQARAEAMHDLLLTIGRKLKQLVTICVVRVRSVRLARLLPTTILRHVH